MVFRTIISVKQLSICSMQRLVGFGSDCFVSRTAVAQWNSHARTVLHIVEITTRNVSQTDPELVRLLIQKKIQRF